MSFINRLFIVAILLTFTFAFSECINSLAVTKNKLKNIIKQKPQLSSNKIIDETVDLFKQIPKIMDKCGEQENAKYLNRYFSHQCMDNLAEGIKFAKRILHQQDNQIINNIDINLFERLFEKKIKKTCPFLQDIQIKKITDKGTCYQAIYDYSLLLQKIEHHNLDSNTINDITNALDKLPNTLDKCDQTQLADKIRKFLPQSCVSAIGVFAQLLVQLEHKYDQFNWILYHYKQMIRDYRQITYTCPLFGTNDKIELKQNININKSQSNGPTYDFMAPFKNYSNHLNLSFQGITTGKSLQFTTNFHQNTSYGTCFGFAFNNLKFSTVQFGNKYVTTVTQNTGKSLDLTQSCIIMGCNSGDAQVLPGVAVPVVSAVSVDGVPITLYSPCASTGCKDPGNGFRLAGYYAQWAVWGRTFNPYHIPFDKINKIFYAFVGFNSSDGSIKSLDSAADGWGMSAIARAMLQYPYLRTHLSFGGWTNNGVTTAPMFQQLTSSQASVDKFANQTITLLRKVGFTGIDIDWQWWSDYADSVAPAKKTLQFYKTLRKALDEAGRVDGKIYSLSAAVNGGTNRIMAMQNSSNPNSVSNFWEQTGLLLDFLNVMNYDYHGSWDVGEPAYFQAPFDFSNTGDYQVQKQLGWSIKDSVATYTSQGYPKNKIIIGMPLDARTMIVDSDKFGGLFQTVKGTGFGDYQSGILDYKCIVNPVSDPATGCGSHTPISGVQGLVYYNQKSNVDVWQIYGKDAYQTWAYNPKLKTFVTYEDIWSAVAKTKYVKQNGLGGLMVWQLDGDAVTEQLSIIANVKKELNN